MRVSLLHWSLRPCTSGVWPCRQHRASWAHTERVNKATSLRAHGPGTQHSINRCLPTSGSKMRPAPPRASMECPQASRADTQTVQWEEWAGEMGRGQAYVPGREHRDLPPAP